MYCIKCECVPFQKKRRIVAKVQCRNIKHDCPKPTCDEPVLLPGRCCKTCPGDQRGKISYFFFFKKKKNCEKFFIGGKLALKKIILIFYWKKSPRDHGSINFKKGEKRNCWGNKSDFVFAIIKNKCLNKPGGNDFSFNIPPFIIFLKMFFNSRGKVYNVYKNENNAF